MTAAISTSSYAAFRAGRDGTPVRVTLGRPRMPEPAGRRVWIYLAEAAPRGWYFNLGPAGFDRHYLRQLDRLGDCIEVKLGWLPGPVCLLCYERRVRGPADCHRRLFADWWTARTGAEVPELDGPRGRRRAR